MISRVCYCFRLSRVSYSLYCNKLSVHNKEDSRLNRTYFACSKSSYDTLQHTNSEDMCFCHFSN